VLTAALLVGAGLVLLVVAGAYMRRS
jgi:hypothetical protein